MAIDARGIPLSMVSATTNTRDDHLLGLTLDALAMLGPLPKHAIVHLDAGYDDQPCRDELARRGLRAEIAQRDREPAPIQAGRRWVVERTHAWGNNYGKLRWCTERRRSVVEFWLAHAIVTRLPERSSSNTASG